jgi:DNA-binding beta-propeller fold protein YncE
VLPVSVRTALSFAIAVVLLAPAASGARPAGGTLVAFASAESEDRLLVVQPITGEILARLRVPDGPHNVAASPDGRVVLVTSPPAGRVTLVDGRSYRVLKTLGGFAYPHDVEVSPDSRFAYVTDERRGEVVVVSVTRRRVVRRLAVGAGPHDLAVSPDGRRLWITHGRHQTWLTHVDSSKPARARVLRRLGAVGAPHDIAFAPHGRRVWVTYWQEAVVGAFSARSGRLVLRRPVGTLPHHVAVDRHRVWISDHEGGRGYVLSERTGRVVRTFSSGPSPHHVSIAAGVAVVVSHDAGTLTAFRDGGARIRSVRVGRGLHGVALVFNP